MDNICSIAAPSGINSSSATYLLSDLKKITSTHWNCFLTGKMHIIFCSKNEIINGCKLPRAPVT